MHRVLVDALPELRLVAELRLVVDRSVIALEMSLLDLDVGSYWVCENDYLDHSSLVMLVTEDRSYFLRLVCKCW